MATFAEIYATYSGRNLLKFREKLCRRLHVTGSTITNWAKGVYEPNNLNKNGLSVILSKPIEELFPSKSAPTGNKKAASDSDTQPFEMDDEMVKKYTFAVINTTIDSVGRCKDSNQLLLLANNIVEQIEAINEGKSIANAENFIEKMKKDNIIRPSKVQMPMQTTTSECLIVERVDEEFFLEIINQVLPLFPDVVTLNKILYSIIKRLMALV